jgi:SAM-dependent methyltransferase
MKLKDKIRPGHMTPPARPSRTSLAKGFRNVDTSGDTDACNRCLDTIAAIRFFHGVKVDSIRIIAEGRPQNVLDAGCGTGIDLLALACALPEPFQVVGLDASTSLLARAAVRTAGIRDRCSLVNGDITEIPFGDSTFDACRIDRVLQHIQDPMQAICELTRILKPGGTLVAFDNDWDTFSISLDDRDIQGQICRFWRDSFASARIGKDLTRFFQECGMTGVSNRPQKLVLTDLQVAEQVFDIPHLLDRMVDAGEVKRGEVTEVRHELRRRAGDGTFTSGYTGYLVHGKKNV